VAADIPTESQQVDFSAPVLKAKQAGADALFVYLNEDESARILREIRKQGYDKPVVGETTIMGQKVIDLAGEAANGVRGHVGLTIDAPLPGIRAFAEKFEKEYKLQVGPQRHQGLHRESMSSRRPPRSWPGGRQALAQALKNACFSAKEQPGLLLDLCFDDKGDIDRESFLVEVKGGSQEVVSILPPLRKR
jgi:branched-chain amino acid transport system substrate-binding protein